MDLTGIIEKLKECETGWAALAQVPDDLFNALPGLNKTDVSSIISSSRIRLEMAQETNQKINPIYFLQISQSVNNLQLYIKQHIPSNPQGHVPGLQGVLSGLVLAIDLGVIPTGESEQEESLTSKIASKLQNKLAESLAKSSAAESMLKTVQVSIEQAKNADTALKEAVKTSQDVAGKIEERDRTTSEATARINETEKKSKTLVTELEGNLKKVNDSSNEVQKQQQELNAISEKLQKKLTEAQQLLEDANRHGLAGAFKTRKDDLSWPTKFWIFTFLISVGALTYFALTNLADSDWHKILLRLPLTAPLIWLGWFSVKQYGYNRRIQEDYAFKVASAMSFQGYKNELTTDADLLKLLRQSAIENFSANPIRIYSEQKNHGSPLHELFENVSEDKLKKIADIVKALSVK